MPDTRSSRRPPLPESAKPIRDELMRIRGLREGLSAETVIRYGEDLQLLVAVTDEMVRRDLPPDQRPDAAAKVVRCAVNHLVKDPWQTFLDCTLLDTRNQMVTDRLDRAGRAVGVVSDSQREEIDAKSYRDLARALVNAEGSPCLGDAPGVVTANLIQIAELTRGIAAALREMGMGAAAEAQQEAARIVDASLPAGARALAHIHDVAERVQKLIETALAQHHVDFRRKADYLEEVVVLYQFAAVALPQIAGFEADSGDLIEVQQGERAEAAEQYARAALADEARLQNSITFVTDALLYEERHDWPSLNV